MVRLHIERIDKEKEFVDIKFWSIVKAYFVGWLGMLLIGSIAFLLIFIISYIFY